MQSNLHQRKITVSVCLIDEDSENITIEFAVTDTGIGIPKEKLATIFDITSLKRYL
jgi:signal transduction histidine kinase